MKIGILTFHRANNLGAVLQAFALQKYININIGMCEIIDYYPNNTILMNNNRLKRFLRFFKRVTFYPFLINRIRRDRLFDSFRDKNLVISKHCFYGDYEIESIELDYDIIISGSDQILNMAITGNSRAYYLQFFEGKKISYASSFGRKEISENEIEAICEELPKFAVLSVREQTAREIIKRLIGKEAQLVLDPVFLLGKNEWSKRCNEKIQLPQKYIFVYSMEVSHNLEQAVKTLKLKTKLPVIVVIGGGKSGIILGNENKTCGPEEFIRYIRDAELVITNSFHGTAFSLIFEKRFICIAHSTRNTRLENIMDMIEMKDYLVTSSTDIFQNKIVDGKNCSEIIERYRCISKKFLKKYIK